MRTWLVRSLVVVAPVLACRSTPSPVATPGGETARLAAPAREVTITRDDWGIAHVRGRTDADAVFGMVYAQAEDDFNRIETNYLTNLGRRAEAEGEALVWQDLRQRLYVHPDSLKRQYAASPAWLRVLMDAWADGLNHYLATHPQVKPRVLTRFEPWMALSFTEGSIGGDIESISLAGLRSFYGDSATRARGTASDGRGDGPGEPGGSNGFAIAPQNTTAGRALLLINPHTSFFFRSELQMTSDEGLNAYGAATWGQFFIYQGFNDRVGWMHTSSGVDVIDEFAETVETDGSRRVYRYGAERRPVVIDTVTIRYRSTGDTLASRRFTVYRTHHGPIVREAAGKWIATALMWKPIEALSQSFLRTKARDFAAFAKAAELRANSSNATIYADADGTIAYFHPQFVPRRDDRFDYTRPVDGSDPATDWRGLTPLDSLPFVRNPSVGWVQNTNNWPYTAAGPDSPKRERFPKYMDGAFENARGLHAVRVLEGRRDFTVQKLIDAAYDSWLPAFADLVPPLVKDFDALGASDPLRARVAEQIAVLRAWDHRWGVASVPTSLAVYWGDELQRRVQAAGGRPSLSPYFPFRDAALALAPTVRLEALAAASDRLVREFGAWRTPWGEINRFQRLTGDIVHRFTDAGPSIPVGFTSAGWGSLASFSARQYPGTKRWYGTSGNSFVAVVEFGRDSVRARAVTAGGESGDPRSRHFNDQAARYATGDLRPVYFYPNQLTGHTERTYRP